MTRIMRAHPVLCFVFLAALTCGALTVAWDRADPTPQRITLDFPREVHPHG